MKFGFYRTTINPTLPCHLEGYQDRISIGQHDDLYINSLYIEGNNPILFHVLDVIIIEKELADECRTILSSKFNIPKDNIIISCIHTHSGPKVSSIICPNILPNSKYIEMLKKTMIKNTEICVNNLKEAKTYFGTADVEGYYCNRNVKDLPFNKTAYTLMFKDLENKPLLCFTNLACHPTILNGSNLYVSSDYVGVMRNEYENITGTPLIFINGECGDVSTRMVRQGADFNEVERVGKGIAKILSKTNNFKEINLENFKIQKYELVIDYNPQKDEFLNEAIPRLKHDINSRDNDDPKKIENRNLLESLLYKYNQEHINLIPTTYVLECNDFRFVTIPGEIVYNLANLLRSSDKKPMFICGYSNDFNIYAVDEAQYGLYFESYNTFYPKGKADEMIKETIKLYNN